MKSESSALSIAVYQHFQVVFTDLTQGENCQAMLNCLLNSVWYLNQYESGPCTISLLPSATE